MKILIASLLVLYSISVFAWDSTGHRIIAQIAYERLNPEARDKIDQLTYSLDKKYPPLSRFLYGSIWPDLIKGKKATRQNNWHFINYPYSPDGTAVIQPPTENILWAIRKSEDILQNTQAKKRKRAIFLRFLVHFVGDAHQPLHCIERYTKEYPSGDKSGNIVPIRDSYVNNLHAYWDEGVGLFREPGKKYPLSNHEIVNLAQKITQDYPTQYFGSQTTDLNPIDWAEESFALSKNFAYNLPENTVPTKDYTLQGQKIVEQRIALAGYRLANLLNKIFG